MKRLLTLIFCILLVATLSVCAYAASVNTLTVITETSTSTTKLSSLPVSKEGLFCGWFTTSSAAKALDTTKAAKDGYAGTVYGAVIPFTEEQLEIVDVEMRTDAPYGIRFLARINKPLVRTLQNLNAKNREGVNGTLTPRTEHNTGIGYGMVLALDSTHTTAITKMSGKNVAAGVTVAGVNTFAENSASITYTATVLGIDEASLCKEIAARPYITYADVNGNERTVYYTQKNSMNGAYSASIYTVAEFVVNDTSATSTQKTAASNLIDSYTGGHTAVLTTIDELNLSSAENSADNDSAYLEFDMSTFVTLDEDNHYSYQSAFYPRITKVRDDLYLMTYMRYQTGDHIFCVTSKDGVNWGTPRFLFNMNENPFTYETGSLKGTADVMLAANADHCLLDDGSVLLVYSVRPCAGYSKPEYANLSRLDIVRGTVNSNGYILWSEPTPIYYGQNWEPEIIKRENGTIEIYFTHIAPMIYKYGYYSEFRSSGVGMLSSTDNGLTWTPNVTANSTATNYSAKRIYQYSAGDFKVQSGQTVPFFCGQMPGVVELTNGKLMIAVEEKKIGDSNFKIGVAWSGANGVWKELGMSEAGPSTMQADIMTGAGPSLSRFNSGEVILTYNASSQMKMKLLNKTGSNIATAAVLSPYQNQAAGFWSFSTVIDSHTAIAGMAHKKYAGAAPETTVDANGEEVTVLHNTITLGKFRLNHTIDATEKTMNLDGNLKDWKYIDDALFVGSQRRTLQSTYRFAYDDNYIYIGIDRVDSAYESGDYNYVNIATADGHYEIKVGNGVYTTGLSGVTFKNAGVIGGRTYEIRLDRKELGLLGEYIRVCPGFVDVASNIDDRINGTSATDTSTWLKINLK